MKDRLTVTRSQRIPATARTMREHELVELSRRDRIAFVKALMNPPAPHMRLHKAMQRHDRLCTGPDNGS